VPGIGTVLTQQQIASLAQQEGIAVLEILGNRVPLFAPAGYAAWSLFNLIATILVFALFLIGLLRFYLARSERREDGGESVRADEKGRVAQRRIAMVILGLVTALVAVILFVLTQDLNNPMVLLDIWSIVFAVALLLATVAMILCVTRRRVSEKKDLLQETFA
jgi:cell division protein FtsW (lipid II flippase)